MDNSKKNAANAANNVQRFYHRHKKPVLISAIILIIVILGAVIFSLNSPKRKIAGNIYTITNAGDYYDGSRDTLIAFNKDGRYIYTYAGASYNESYDSMQNNFDWFYSRPTNYGDSAASGTYQIKSGVLKPKVVNGSSYIEEIPGHNSKIIKVTKNTLVLESTSKKTGDGSTYNSKKDRQLTLTKVGEIKK